MSIQDILTQFAELSAQRDEMEATVQRVFSGETMSLTKDTEAWKKAHPGASDEDVLDFQNTWTAILVAALSTNPSPRSKLILQTLLEGRSPEQLQVVAQSLKALVIGAIVGAAKKSPSRTEAPSTQDEAMPPPEAETADADNGAAISDQPDSSPDPTDVPDEEEASSTAGVTEQVQEPDASKPDDADLKPEVEDEGLSLDEADEPDLSRPLVEDPAASSSATARGIELEPQKPEDPEKK